MILIGDKKFKTKKASYEFIKNRLYAIGEIEIDSGDDFDLLCDLVFHPQCSIQDKELRKKLKSFILYKIKQTGDTLHLNVKAHDGTIKQISWKDCSRRSHTQGDDLCEAFRNAIHQFTYEFKLEAICVCVYCQSTENPQVDHIISFHKIKSDFLKLITGNLPSRFDKNEYGSSVFMARDKEFEQKWIKFHNDIAKYQILCITCNIKKGNK